MLTKDSTVLLVVGVMSVIVLALLAAPPVTPIIVVTALKVTAFCGISSGGLSILACFIIRLSKEREK